MAIVTRFAPSPTGRLHAGNLRTALFNWCLARGAGGRFLLRSEDTDTARGGTPELAVQLEDLAWFGLDWDGGPDRPAPEGPFRQSERLSLYREHLGQLAESGRAYACYRSDEELKLKRAELKRAGLPPRYDREWARLPHDEVVRRRQAGHPFPGPRQRRDCLARPGPRSALAAGRGSGRFRPGAQRRHAGFSFRQCAGRCADGRDACIAR
jgi:glutamyl/glutaminyl-tRNA synthetase